MHWRQKYQILSLLKESFKGAVFLVQNRQTQETLVCRLLYHTSADPYRLLQKVSSPHVPRIFQIIQDGADTVVVEEYIQGETLAACLARNKIFLPEEILSIAQQICLALAAIHSQGVIHRDVKPENILLCTGRAVLIDFDIARRYRRNQSKDTIYMGTEGYAAPEQYGFAQTDRRSDIYAFGMVLQELCNGDVAHLLAAIIQRCTAFDPDCRYASAEEILADLQQTAQLLSRKDAFSHSDPLPAKGGKSSIRRKCIIILYIFFALQTAVILIPQPYEITVYDYFLSKLVYLQLVFFPAAIIFHLLGVWQWLPLLRQGKKWSRTVGAAAYLLLFLVMVIALNMLAYALYSPEALHILQSLEN